MSAKSIQTSLTCPTPPRMEGSGLEEPDDRVNVSQVDWQRDLLAAVQPPPPETQQHGLGINNNNYSTMSSLNTPTFDFEAPEFPAPLMAGGNDNISIEDMWNIRAGSPEHMPAAPLQLVEGMDTDDNIFTLQTKDLLLFQPAFPAQEEKLQPVHAGSPGVVSSYTTVLSPKHTVTVPLKQEVLSTINAHDWWAEDTKVTVPVKEEEHFDLLSFIVNDSIKENTMIPGEEQPAPVEIPAVVETVQLPHPLAMPSTTSSSTSSRPVEHPEKSAPRRKRGRPALPLGARTITPRVNRQLASGDESTDTAGNLTDQDIEHLRYRRMRDLNNEASKRCRESRKRKFDALERERDTELQRNMDLKKRFTDLQAEVFKLKEFYVSNYAPGARPIPDPALMWSMMDLKPDDVATSLNDQLQA